MSDILILFSVEANLPDDERSELLEKLAPFNPEQVDDTTYALKGNPSEMAAALEEMQQSSTPSL